MAGDADVRAVLRSYPQIYLACHVDHVRAASTEWQLSARDSSVLAHLDTNTPVSPRALAAHLGVRSSTLSATLARLESLGYIRSGTSEHDKRKRELTLTERGDLAMASTSVLDRSRVERLLDALTEDERRAAVRGLSLLARAARGLAKSEERT